VEAGRGRRCISRSTVTLSSATFGIEIETDQAGVEMKMTDEAVEQVVRRVVREELGSLRMCTGGKHGPRAGDQPELLTVPEVAEVLRVFARSGLRPGEGTPTSSGADWTTVLVPSILLASSFVSMFSS
jgi:hypothetical protein